MKWSVPLGRIAGIKLQMHLTFLLLLGYVAFVFWTQGQSVAAALYGVIFMLAIFSCVILHELGHALTARRYGIQTRDITLLPIGGLARLERMPDQPMQEFWVALAGPAVNVVIAALLVAWLVFTGALSQISGLDIFGSSFVANLATVNIWLVLFNLLPAFPMDGGRVLRAVLALRLEYTRATQVAASVGQGMAFLFGFVGLFGLGSLIPASPILLFIALFVWIGAAQEASMVQMKSSLSGIPVGRAMLTDFQVLAPHDRLDTAVQLTLKSSQKDYPVVGDGRVLGVLVQSDLLKALSSEGLQRRVSDVMRREFLVVDPFEMLETALARLRECSCSTLPVLRHGRLVGLVTMDNIGEFLSIQAALERAR